MLQKYAQLVSNCHLATQCFILQTSHILIVKNQSQNHFHIDQSCQGTINFQTKQRVIKSLNYQAKELCKSNHIEPYLKFHQGILSGKKLPQSIAIYKKTQSVIKNIEFIAGVVSILFIYDMRNEHLLWDINRILKPQKLKWKDKIKVIVVTLKQMEFHLSKFLENQQIQAQVYLFENHQEARLLKHFMSFCLIDTQKKIDTVDPNLYNFNLGKRVNQLLGQREHSLFSESVLSYSQIVKFINMIKNQKLKPTWLQKCEGINLEVHSESNYKLGRILNKLRVSVNVHQVDQDLAEWLQSHFQQTLGHQIFNISIIKQVTVPRNSLCTQCHNQLGQFYYWCYWSKNQNDIRCRSCIETLDQRQNYKYFGNSILISKDTEKIHINRFGKNYQPKDQNCGRYQGCYTCNFCQKQPTEKYARYISLDTKSYIENELQEDFDDLCQPCMIQYINGNKQVRQSIQSKNHAFLRVLYNTKGYYRY